MCAFYLTAGLLTLVLAVKVLERLWLQSRCAKLGHRWRRRDDGLRCSRCRLSSEAFTTAWWKR